MLEISSRSASGRRRGQDDVKLSQEPSPHPLPAVLPADVRRFLDIIRRWSGNEAPRGAAWRVQPDADREWYQREILESGLAEGLDMIAVLTGWDEFLEMAARGQKRCRFPVNFKNSLRNQVSMWQQRQSGRTAAHASTATTSETNKHADGSSTAGVARKLPGGRDPDGARFPTREQWHVEADGRRKSLSYADHLERAKRSGTEAWSRERFDAFVRKNGLEPVD